jgi:hypothetical protein
MRPRRSIAALCLVALLCACTGWAAPQSSPPSPGGKRVLVTTVRGDEVVLRDPSIDEQDYVGWSVQRDQERRIPLDSIRSFQVEDFQEGRTLLVILAIPVLVIGVYIATGCGSYGCD